MDTLNVIPVNLGYPGGTADRKCSADCEIFIKCWTWTILHNKLRDQTSKITRILLTLNSLVTSYYLERFFYEIVGLGAGEKVANKIKLNFLKIYSDYGGTICGLNFLLKAKGYKWTESYAIVKANLVQLHQLSQ